MTTPFEKRKKLLLLFMCICYFYIILSKILMSQTMHFLCKLCLLSGYDRWKNLNLHIISLQGAITPPWEHPHQISGNFDLSFQNKAHLNIWTFWIHWSKFQMTISLEILNITQLFHFRVLVPHPENIFTKLQEILMYHFKIFLLDWDANKAILRGKLFN